MIVKNKKLYSILLIVVCIIGYILWIFIRPVEIVAVHKNEEFSYVLVRNYPLTDRGKINWWLENKGLLQKKYNIPTPAKNGYFSITFWNFGDGYKEEGKYDRFCFDDMPPPVNCIEKDAVFTVSNSKNRGIIFTVYDGTYHLKNNGEVVKLKSD